MVHCQEIIRRMLLLALDDPHRKICTAIGMAVASIAVHDWPELWPDLLPFLLNLINNQANLNGGKQFFFWVDVFWDFVCVNDWEKAFAVPSSPFCIVETKRLWYEQFISLNCKWFACWFSFMLATSWFIYFLY